MSKVIIIGAGIGGLATANLLAKSGHEVAVYEKQSAPGGRAGTIEIDGFTFDTGPSWYLMPEVFEHYFELLGEDIREHLSLSKLDPAYKVFHEDGSEPITIRAVLDEDRRTFEAIEPGAGDKLDSYLQASSAIYKTAIQNFLYTNFDRPASMLSPGILRMLPTMARAATTPINRHIGRYFTDNRLRQILQYPMVFLGTSPFEAPAIYSLMSHMDFTQGVYYPTDGLYSVIRALERIGMIAGVQYHYGSPVSRIISKDKKATAIELEDGSIVDADMIISNADLHFTETQLLEAPDQTYPERYWDRKQAGPSALLLYLGVKGSLPQLTHHNLLFTSDWHRNFDAIYKDKAWPEPASIYICKPSHTDKSVAPKGYENLFVLVPAPAKLGTERNELARLADSYLQQIAVMTGIPDLADRIVVRHMVGPDDFAADFNSWQGTALGLSHKLTQSALFRPANKSKKLDNLYYVGGNTMPGVGLPMCLISAELVYKRLAGDKTSAPLQQLRRLTDA